MKRTHTHNWRVLGVSVLLCAALVFGCQDSSNPVATCSTLPCDPEITIDMEFVGIKAGTFEMGSDNGDSDEKPVHTVTLTRDFYMSKYETTRAQYVAVTGSNPSRFTADDNRPVEEVSWFDAIRFANALSASEGLNPCYDNDGNVLGGAGGNPYQCEGYRLPTEAEWEYAARAGTTTDYYFGDDTGQLGDHAWHINNSGSTTHPVGQKQPNAWGLYDMHGNVWEWVYDWYGSSYYSGSPSTNPPGPQAGSTRVGHGGGWDTTAPFQRSANRFTGTPGVRNPYLGFRLVRTGQ